MSSGARAGGVAIVHDWLTGMRGGEKVLERLADMFPEAPIYTLFHFQGSVSNVIESHEIETSVLRLVPGLRRHYRYYLPLFPWAIERFDFSRFDLVLSSSHCVARGARAAAEGTHVCYCHTPMRYVWDQQTAYFPNSAGPIGRLRSAALARLRRWDRRTSDRVDHYIANSSFVAERIRNYYRREAAVIPPPVDTDYYVPPTDPGVDETGAGTEAFALCVAALAPYKRLDLAILGCRAAGLPLRIVGSGPDLASLRALAEDDPVEFCGRVDAEQLRRLYQSASFLLQPGIEDFGISAVEALACATPIVALGQGGILDIVEPGVHGLLYSQPESAAAIAEAIDKARSIRFNQLKLRQRAELFSAPEFDRRVLEHLAGCLPEPVRKALGLA